MTDKEFELQYDLAQARERMDVYTKTISDQTLEISRLKGVIAKCKDALETRCHKTGNVLEVKDCLNISCHNHNARRYNLRLEDDNWDCKNPECLTWSSGNKKIGQAREEALAAIKEEGL